MPRKTSGLLDSFGTLSPRVPSARERLAGLLSGVLGQDNRQGYQSLLGLLGQSSSATPESKLMDMSNPTGRLLGAYDSGTDIGRGAYVAGGLGLLGAMMPGIPAKMRGEVGIHLRDVERPNLSRLQNRERNLRSDTGDWNVQELPIRALYGTQDKVNADFFPEALSKTDLPFVLKVDGKYYVQDGHHRLSALADEGKQTARVRVVDLDHSADQGTPLLDWKNK